MPEKGLKTAEHSYSYLKLTIYLREAPKCVQYFRKKLEEKIPEMEMWGKKWWSEFSFYVLFFIFSPIYQKINYSENYTPLYIGEVGEPRINLELALCTDM